MCSVESSTVPLPSTVAVAIGTMVPARPKSGSRSSGASTSTSAGPSWGAPVHQSYHRPAGRYTTRGAPRDGTPARRAAHPQASPGPRSPPPAGHPRTPRAAGAGPALRWSPLRGTGCTGTAAARGAAAARHVRPPRPRRRTPTARSAWSRDASGRASSGTARRPGSSGRRAPAWHRPRTRRCPRRRTERPTDRGCTASAATAEGAPTTPCCRRSTPRRSAGSRRTPSG